MAKLRHLTFATAAFFVTACATTNGHHSNAYEQESQSGALINRSEVVAVVHSVDHAIDLEQKAARWGYDLKRKETLEGLDVYLLTFDCPPGIDPYVASEELERLQPQSTVEANHKYTLQMSELGRQSFQPREYANTLIQWPEDGCDGLLKVGSIDGQVDIDVASLKSAKIQLRNFLPPKKISSNTRHGTAVAQLLVGEGRLRNTELFAGVVVSEDEEGNAYSGVRPILRALDWMIKSDVDIVNISLAGPYNRTLEVGIEQATRKGLIIVAAVGNDGVSAAPKYPAALNNVIAATAVDHKKNIYQNAVQGQHVDIAAPGVDVFVGDETQGRYISGTSIAAPFVVAKIASDKQFKNLKSAKKIRKVLAQTSQDLGEKGHDRVFGYGLIGTNKHCKI